MYTFGPAATARVGRCGAGPSVKKLVMATGASSSACSDAFAVPFHNCVSSGASRHRQSSRLLEARSRTDALAESDFLLVQVSCSCSTLYMADQSDTVPASSHAECPIP
eukprot:GHRQ01034432.1.p2 GENE.GHRQ01034432.1~~GHRQ01034432.1.p2  ORF type:complete len:108 (-),score=13.90 GHRQ01034432.1:370-693(-)